MQGMEDMKGQSVKPNVPQHLFNVVQDVINAEKREKALLELSKEREKHPDIAVVIWNSFGTIAALLQEIVSIYPLLSPPRLTKSQSDRCCNALALLQCVASHHRTRGSFLKAHIPLYMYPFLTTVATDPPYTTLRLTSLGVIGALVKVDNATVIHFLLNTEIIPLCLRIMENGDQLSKAVATFIIQKILVDENGLAYICHTWDRFRLVSGVLQKVVAGLASQRPIDRHNKRLLKTTIQCYLQLSVNQHARKELQKILPEQLRDNTFAMDLKDERQASVSLQQLMHNIGTYQTEWREPVNN